MQLKTILLVVVSFLGLHLSAQQITPINGVYSPSHTTYAFTNAHLVISPGNEVNGTLLIKDGLVVASGANVDIPHGAVIMDLKGKYIYPSFIELYSNYGMPEVAKRKHTPKPEFVAKNNGSTYWNDAIHPQLDASTLFNPDSKKSTELMKLGFGSVLSHPINGIMRGQAVFVSLGNSQSQESIYKNNAAAYLGFGKGNSSQVYPTSLMGSIALIRQAMYDAQWYATSSKTPENFSLQAIEDQKNAPYFFDARNYQSVLRASKIGTEFNLPVVAVSGGEAYKHIDQIKNSGASLIVPLNFPKPYDVADPLDAEYISLSKMRHWEMAPFNAAILNQNEVSFALSATANPKEFLKNLRIAVANGLSEQAALKALTVNPATYINLENEIGTLEPGKKANFIICEDNIFTSSTPILENWTNGERHIFTNSMAIDPSGLYNLNLNGVLYKMSIENGPKGYTILTTMGEKKDQLQKGKITIENNLLTVWFETGNKAFPGPIRMVGKVNFKGKIIDGKAQDANGKWATWTAIKQKENNTENALTKKDSTQPSIPQIYYPNMAYGDTTLPQANNYFIKNVMVWTSDSTGKFKGFVAVSNGKIEAVGKRLSNPGDYTEIDGTGLHLTAGIIDEHSHIAISGGVNEGGQNNTAEVRIGDVLNSDDINIYRQLAGGVTTVQLLHGSANPIGGQSAIIKLRWGSAPEQLKFEGASKTIKFALGENVKQSNSDRRNSIRFPQTRMGVEQVYVDAFSRAKAYEKSMLEFKNTTKKERKNGASAPRRDLELETLVEIMNNERYITCHSYIQSEITMLMNVADSMGFKVNTFTHILEGYKVADKMKAHGANASTFADWWAYKFEVNDAIPYNAAILSKQGITVAINSDDAEMARRLNQEAAKTVKYGGVSEIEAIKMITINPAKMMHIDHRVGSISVGKDADLVLWSDHPLSVYAHPLFTMIDGKMYFSAARDEALQQQNAAERQRLILAMMKAKSNGAKTQKVKHKTPHLYHCDSYEEETTF